MNRDPNQSARPCGCDPGANHVCDICRRIRETGRHDTDVVGGRLDGVPASRYTETPLGHGQRLVERENAMRDTTGARIDDNPVRLTTIKDSGKRVTYASGSQRDPSEGKIKWSRITFGPMMRRWAEHLTAAEAKYPDPTPGIPNFSLIETEEELVRYKESAFRHFMAWFHGETDEDHAAATFFNINGVELIKDKRRAQ